MGGCGLVSGCINGCDMFANKWKLSVQPFFNFFYLDTLVLKFS